MSKRFIDTGIYDDDWFMELSKDAKILWFYFITKCDHAGIIKLNEKLCKVQTDIKDLDSIIKQLGNRLIRVSEHLYFIPKFIEFQYPGFPNSQVRQQQSAVEILKKYNLFDEEKLTVKEQLTNSYDNDNVLVNVNENETVNKGRIEIISKLKYADFVSLTSKEYQELCDNHTEPNAKIFIEILNNYKGSTGKKYKSDYRTILNWVIDRAKKEGKYIQRQKLAI